MRQGAFCGLDASCYLELAEQNLLLIEAHMFLVVSICMVAIDSRSADISVWPYLKRTNVPNINMDPICKIL